MYDDEDDDDDEDVEEETQGPASGGYGAADDVEAEEDASGPDAETVRRLAAETARGKEDRAFYDNLAKEEDARHNAMRKDLERRSLAAGELRQKLRHKEAELRALLQKITIEEDRIDYEQKKKYRAQASVIPGEDGAMPPEPIPILSKDIAPKEDESDAEFSVDRAIAHIKQIQAEKDVLAATIREMEDHLHDEERALSQLQHQLIRM